MNILDVKLNNIIDELLEVLADEVIHIKLILRRLNELRAGVVRRDEETLKGLFGEIEEDSANYAVVEAKRESLRQQLADSIGCDMSQMTLTKLCESIEDRDRREAMRDKQSELKILIVDLRREHKQTQMLLIECSRLNKMLLRGIFGNGKETVTYNSNGNKQWELEKGAINLKL